MNNERIVPLSAWLERASSDLEGLAGPLSRARRVLPGTSPMDQAHVWFVAKKTKWIL